LAKVDSKLSLIFLTGSDEMFYAVGGVFSLGLIFCYSVCLVSGYLLNRVGYCSVQTELQFSALQFHQVQATAPSSSTVTPPDPCYLQRRLS